MGMRHRRSYRVVAIESRNARDGRYLEALGHYDPRSKQLELNMERVEYWTSKGARPSNTVSVLIKRHLKKQQAAAGEPDMPEAPTVAEMASEAAAEADLTPESPEAAAEKSEEAEAPAEMAVAEAAGPITEVAESTPQTEKTTSEPEGAEAEPPVASSPESDDTTSTSKNDAGG